MRRLLSFCTFALLIACSSPGTQNPPPAPPPAPAAATDYTGKLPLEKIKLPPGFHIGLFAEGVKNARSLCLSPAGTLFVSTRDAGNVYALRDTNGDHHADQFVTLAKNLNMPNGVAFRNGALYVAEVSRILRYDNIEKTVDALVRGEASRQPAQPARGEASREPVVVYDGYPTDDSHGWKYIAFGPDGKLYIPVGAPCNICEPTLPIYATITRLDVSKPGAQPEIVERGIRNTVGFDWHPVSGDLWFTDNGRDWLGDDQPPCELNHATREGEHFGFPYCHAGTIIDPDYGKGHSCTEFVPPAQNLGPHVAPLGLEFYTGKMFPQAYVNQAFIAEHGSWNRTAKIGYRVSVVRLDAEGHSLGYEPFAEGWLQPGDQVWGRPVDLEQLPDGSLLVSDDYADAIYRIWYDGR